jgi:hypothetical protein
MYGLTEAFRSTFLPPEEVDRRPASIGRAIPECEVFPHGDGRRAPTENPASSCIAGLVSWHWNRQDTARVLRPIRFPPCGDIVCCPDLVVEDEEGSHVAATTPRSNRLAIASARRKPRRC